MFDKTLKQFVKPVYQQLRSSLIVNRNLDWRTAIFISSGARTGSTWVSQLVNYRNEYRFLYEPFFIRPLGFPALQQFLPDKRIQYLRPNNDDRKLISQAEYILSGRFRHPHVDQYNTKFVCARRLVKEVQSNLWVKWLKTHFPSLPIILLLRHPIPTIRSRYADYFRVPPSYRGDVDVDPGRRRSRYLDLVFGQKDLVDDHLASMRSQLESADTVMEQRTVIWCIQNYVPLRQFQRGEIFITFYENYCIEPEKEIRRLNAYLGQKIDDSSLSRFLTRLRKPSANSKLKAEMLDGWKMVTSWQKKATAQDISQTAAVLKLFGLDAVYSAADPLPNADGAAELLGRPTPSRMS
ncbi:MAG: sulfotransferase [Candidatus Eremiobacteraeota bacterium]|nr:sulfotransferase [Candidatus Eremiobacteraeota bacterium]